MHNSDINQAPNPNSNSKIDYTPDYIALIQDGEDVVFGILDYTLGESFKPLNFAVATPLSFGTQFANYVSQYQKYCDENKKKVDSTQCFAQAGLRTFCDLAYDFTLNAVLGSCGLPALAATQLGKLHETMKSSLFDYQQEKNATRKNILERINANPELQGWYEQMLWGEDDLILVDDGGASAFFCMKWYNFHDDMKTLINDTLANGANKIFNTHIFSQKPLSQIETYHIDTPLLRETKTKEPIATPISPNPVSSQAELTDNNAHLTTPIKEGKQEEGTPSEQALPVTAKLDNVNLQAKSAQELTRKIKEEATHPEKSSSFLEKPLVKIALAILKEGIESYLEMAKGKLDCQQKNNAVNLLMKKAQQTARFYDFQFNVVHLKEQTLQTDAFTKELNYQIQSNLIRTCADREKLAQKLFDRLNVLEQRKQTLETSQTHLAENRKAIEQERQSILLELKKCKFKLGSFQPICNMTQAMYPWSKEGLVAMGLSAGLFGLGGMLFTGVAGIFSYKHQKREHQKQMRISYLDQRLNYFTSMDQQSLELDRWMTAQLNEFDAIKDHIYSICLGDPLLLSPQDYRAALTSSIENNAQKKQQLEKENEELKRQQADLDKNEKELQERRDYLQRKLTEKNAKGKEGHKKECDEANDKLKAIAIEKEQNKNAMARNENALADLDQHTQDLLKDSEFAEATKTMRENYYAREKNGEPQRTEREQATHKWAVMISNDYKKKNQANWDAAHKLASESKTFFQELSKLTGIKELEFVGQFLPHVSQMYQSGSLFNHSLHVLNDTMKDTQTGFISVLKNIFGAMFTTQDFLVPGLVLVNSLLGLANLVYSCWKFYQQKEKDKQRQIEIHNLQKKAQANPAELIHLVYKLDQNLGVACQYLQYLNFQTMKAIEAVYHGQELIRQELFSICKRLSAIENHLYYLKLHSTKLDEINRNLIQKTRQDDAKESAHFNQRISDHISKLTSKCSKYGYKSFVSEQSNKLITTEEHLFAFFDILEEFLKLSGKDENNFVNHASYEINNLPLLNHPQSALCYIIQTLNLTDNNHSKPINLTLFSGGLHILVKYLYMLQTRHPDFLHKMKPELTTNMNEVIKSYIATGHEISEFYHSISENYIWLIKVRDQLQRDYEAYLNFILKYQHSTRPMHFISSKFPKDPHSEVQRDLKIIEEIQATSNKLSVYSDHSNLPAIYLSQNWIKDIILSDASLNVLVGHYARSGQSISVHYFFRQDTKSLTQNNQKYVFGLRFSFSHSSDTAICMAEVILYECQNMRHVYRHKIFPLKNMLANFIYSFFGQTCFKDYVNKCSSKGLLDQETITHYQNSNFKGYLDYVNERYQNHQQKKESGLLLSHDTIIFTLADYNQNYQQKKDLYHSSPFYHFSLNSKDSNRLNTTDKTPELVVKSTPLKLKFFDQEVISFLGKLGQEFEHREQKQLENKINEQDSQSFRKLKESLYHHYQALLMAFRLCSQEPYDKLANLIYRELGFVYPPVLDRLLQTDPMALIGLLVTGQQSYQTLLSPELLSTFSLSDKSILGEIEDQLSVLNNLNNKLVTNQPIPYDLTIELQPAFLDAPNISAKEIEALNHYAEQFDGFQVSSLLYFENKITTISLPYEIQYKKFEIINILQNMKSLFHLFLAKLYGMKYECQNLKNVKLSMSNTTLNLSGNNDFFGNSCDEIILIAIPYIVNTLKQVQEMFF